MRVRALLMLLALHAVVDAAFLWSAGPGFPLDDSWVHMVYARAVGRGDGFAYNPGQLESGVTAPLWTTLLGPPVAASDVLGVRPDVAVRVVGALFGLAAAWAGWRLASRAGKWPGAFAAVALSVDPLLVFDRFSGMEQPLFAFLALLLVEALLDEREARAGVLAGALALTRPEGLILAGLAIVWLARRGCRLPRFVGPWLLCLLPWLAYCQVATGRPWPATFENKAEMVLDVPATLTSLAALFGDTGWGWSLPAVVVIGLFVLEGQERHLGRMPVLAAVLLLAGVLVSRPLLVADGPFRVPYYWARYALLGWPLVVMVAAVGFGSLVRTAYAGLKCRPAFAAALVGPLVLVLVGMGSLPVHAHEVRRRFSAECGDVESLNVAAGHWVAENIAPDGLVATHDAGAIRYFGRRTVLDIWGNHNTTLLRLLRDDDPAAAERWLLRQEPDALIVFPLLWAFGHSQPEQKELYALLPPQEFAAVMAGIQPNDFAAFFGLTRRVATFSVPAPATVPSPGHAHLAVFQRP